MTGFYCKRPLLNGDQLFDWAHSSGFTEVLDPTLMHVTIAYSRAHVDAHKLKLDMTDILVIKPEVPRQMVSFDKGSSALRFDSPHLSKRWRYFLDHGASWDYPGYTPHVSVSYRPSELRIDKMKPFDGQLIFGPEEWEPLNLEWAEQAAHV